MPASKKQDERRLVVRLPEPLAEALAALAEQHTRSLNGEIVHALQGYIAREVRNDRQSKT